MSKAIVGTKGFFQCSVCKKVFKGRKDKKYCPACWAELAGYGGMKE